MKKIIATGNAPAAIGPYSQAIDCGSFLVTSGQVPFDPATGEFVPGGITEQTAVYAEFFTEGQYPARSAVEVGALPRGALVEIETICVK